MRTSILAALMAATALIPAAAMAQRGDRDGNPGWQRGERQTQGERLEGRQPRQRNEARPERVRPAPQAPVATAQPQAQPQGRPQRVEGGNRGDWAGNDGQRGDRGPRGGFGGPARGGQGGHQPAPGRTPIVQPERQANRDGGVYRGDRRPGGDSRVTRGNDTGRQWRGNDGRAGEWRGIDGRGNDGRGGQWRGNGGRGNNWNRNWRQDNRYDWNRRRQYDRNIYHLPRYYAPNGWNSGYRRFGIGFTLSSILFNQNYWINDAEYYGLPDAYGDYRWVRYYNDALLVDTYSGEVVDTVYDIFW